jgi:hypothetical protein
LFVFVLRWLILRNIELSGIAYVWNNDRDDTINNGFNPNLETAYHSMSSWQACCFCFDDVIRMENHVRAKVSSI